MAGIKLSTIEKTLKSKKIVRIMPNVMAFNNKSQTHIYMKNKNLFDSKLKKILNFNNDYKYIFLLVRPKTFLTSGNQFQKYLSKETLVISCMAGIKLSTIEKTLSLIHI